jgi:hypothetical protein
MLYAPLTSPMRLTCPAHLILLALITLTHGVIYNYGTPWSRVLLEMLVVNKVPTFYGTEWFIILRYEVLTALKTSTSPHGVTTQKSSIDVHCPIYRSLSLNPVLMNPVHIRTPYFLKV